MRDNAPNLEIALLAHVQFGKLLVGWSEIDAIAAHTDALDREVTVNKADCNVAIVRIERLVDDEQVAIADAGINHRVADDAGTKRRSRVADEFTVQVDGVAKHALSRAGKSRLYAALEESQGYLFGIFNGV